MALAALLAGIAQQPPAPPTAPAPAGGDREVVVTGERIRGSAIGTVPPIATLDPDTLRALGVSTVKDMLQRLKGLTASGGGGEPVPLLNGRRISGWQELYDIPFEAIERTEILPEEEASHTLGATDWQTTWRVILPALVPAIFTGASQAFIRSLGEFGAVVMIAGNIPYKTEITSLMIFVRLSEYDYAAASAIASVVLGASLLLLFLLQVLQGRLLPWQRPGV